MRDALKVAVAAGEVSSFTVSAGEVSSFTVSAVTGIPFRFVLAHDKARYEDSVPQFAECCGERR